MLENLVYISTLLVAGATMFLVWLTARYVRLTKEMVDEMRVNREPSVFVDLEIAERGVKYSIGNLSPSPAINVKVELVCVNIPWLITEKNNNPFSKTISYIPPNRTYQYQGGPIKRNEIDKNSTGEFHFKISYINENNKKYNREIIYNLNQYSELLYSTFHDPIHYVAQAIGNLERSRSHERNIDQLRKSIYQQDSMKTKLCKFCGEKIAEIAIKCPHCLEMQKKIK